MLPEKEGNEGEIQISFRGDGKVLKDWNLEENPEPLGSRFQVGWLRAPVSRVSWTFSFCDSRQLHQLS